MAKWEQVLEMFFSYCRVVALSRITLNSSLKMKRPWLTLAEKYADKGEGGEPGGRLGQSGSTLPAGGGGTRSLHL